MILLTSITPAYASILFESEFLLENVGNAWVIDSNDDVVGDISLQFGNTLGKSISFDTSNNQFELSDDLSLGQNQLKDFALEGLATAPISPVTGQIYHNTTDSNTYIFNGSTWEDITDTGVGPQDLDDTYDNDPDKILNVDNASGLEFNSTVTSDIKFDLQSTGDVAFQNAGVNFALFNDSGIFDLTGVQDTERIRLTDTTNVDSVGLYTGLGDPDGALSAEAGSFFLDQGGDAYINRSTGSGTDWGRLIATGGPSQYAQTVEVAKSGAEFTSVKAALDSIIDATTSKRYTVLVYPGIYTEDPITIPDYVSIDGVGNYENINIIASTPGSVLITAGQKSVMRNVSIEGATGSSCYKTAKQSYVFQVGLKDCGTGIYVSGASADLHLENALADSGTFTDVVKIDAAGTADLNWLIIQAGTTITNGINITGNGSSLISESIEIVSPTATNGIYTNNTVDANIARAIIKDATYGIHIGPDGTSTVRGPGGFVENSDSRDIYVESSTAELFLAGWRVNAEKFDIHEDARVVISFTEDTPGDESFSIYGELHVGSPEHPREIAIGEGDSYTNGMMIYTYNGSTYTDVSTAASSYTGSTFTLPGITVNNALYISSDRKNTVGNFVKFLGYKYKMGGTALTPGAGEVVHEYWNGSSWVDLNNMCTHSSLFYRYDKSCFLRPSTSEQMRFNEAMTDDWAVNDPPTTGTNRYWIRIRVNTAITTAPVFEQFKIHTNRTEINGDGSVTYHGTARKLSSFVVSPETIFFARGNNTPDNRSFTVGSGGVSWTDERSSAAFTGVGIITEELTGSIALPKGIDTSSGLVTKIYWMKVNGNTGNTEWKMDYYVDSVQNVNIADGSNVTPAPRATGQSTSATAGTTIQTTATGSSTAANVPILSTFEKIDISSHYEGDTLFLRLYRDPADPDDTYSSDATMVGFEISGIFWTDGENS